MRHQKEQAMKFGIFDHLDRNELPMAQYYEERLKLVELYDRTDFHAYHVAEHHSTPLGMAPSPSVFLSAVAQRTRRLRFAPLTMRLIAARRTPSRHGRWRAPSRRICRASRCMVRVCRREIGSSRQPQHGCLTHGRSTTWRSAR